MQRFRFGFGLSCLVDEKIDEGENVYKLIKEEPKRGGVGRSGYGILVPIT